MYDGLKFEMADLSRFDEISDTVMDQFYADHPICSLFGLNRQNDEGFFDEYIREGFGDPPMSVLCTKNDQIIGCRMCSMIDPKKLTSDRKSATLYKRGYKSKNLQLLSDYYEKLSDENFIPKNEKFLRFLFVWVRKDHCRKGLAESMNRIAIQRAKNFGCRCVTGIANSYKSQAMYEKLGFEAVETFLHKDFKDENGRPIFECQDASYCGQVLRLNL